MATYEETARASRIKCLELVFRAQTSHIGSVLGVADIMVVLFEQDLKINRFICSKGWVACLIYYHQARKRLIPKEDLERYCLEGEEKYIGLIEPIGGFGAEFAGGSMQMGVAAGVGLALAKKIKKEDGKIFVLESDGAIAGGMIWESASIASQHKLSNLCVIFEINGWQAMGKTEDILDMSPLRDKFESFGWEVTEIDGHDYAQIEESLKKETNKPHCVLAKTVKGKGVSFMEKDGLMWHYKNIPEDLYKLAMEELCQK